MVEYLAWVGGLRPPPTLNPSPTPPQPRPNPNPNPSPQPPPQPHPPQPPKIFNPGVNKAYVNSLRPSDAYMRQ